MSLVQGPIDVGWGVTLMYIVEVLERFGDNFAFKSYCQDCETFETWPDGYADSYFQNEVFLNRKCPSCGKTEMEIQEEIRLEMIENGQIVA